MAATNRTEVAQAIANLVAKSKNQKTLAKDIANYLVSQRQTKDLELIMRDVMTTRANQGIVEAQLTVAFPLSSGVQKEVDKLLRHEYPKAKQLVYHQVVEPEVLSGIKIQTADKQLDETARGKLNKLTQAAA